MEVADDEALEHLLDQDRVPAAAVIGARSWVDWTPMTGRLLHLR